MVREFLDFLSIRSFLISLLYYSIKQLILFLKMSKNNYRFIFNSTALEDVTITEHYTILF